MAMDLQPATEDRPHLWQAATHSPTFVAGAVLTAIVLMAAAVSLVWTPYDYAAQDIPHRLMGLSAAHWFGTDQYGRDVFSQILVGARTSIAVALIAVLVGVGVGTPLGLWAAAARGTLLDDAIMRANDLVFAFPALLIAVLITAVFGPGAINATVAIGIFNIPVFARISRSAALSLWETDFIRAARLAGKGATRISAEHVLPNISNTLVVQITIQFSLGILAEAALAYVGLGAQPPLPSWGKMLADSQTLVGLAPHLALIPGAAIVLTVFGLNLMGDGLRDIFDPRRQRSRL